jgi:hypothetical protein
VRATGVARLARDRLLKMAEIALPFVAGYQAKTTREIQLVALERKR